MAVIIVGIMQVCMRTDADLPRSKVVDKAESITESRFHCAPLPTLSPTVAKSNQLCINLNVWALNMNVIEEGFFKTERIITHLQY